MTSETDIHVFISHAWIDGTDHAKRLYDALTKRGISAWLDLTNMNPFNDFSGEIDRQIKRASHVVVCVTPDVDRENSYVRNEIGYANGHRKPIIAALFEEMIPLSLIVNHTRVYFSRNWDTAFTQVIDYLSKPRDYEAPADDPFQEYLDRLRQDIEDYLNIAIIREIPLHSQETPGAVQTTTTKRMLGSLFNTTLAVKPEEHKPPRAFDSIGDAFQHFGGRMLLLGEPGAGKTITMMTFVRAMLASRLADQTRPLPIFARIADWDGKTALIDWLAGQLPISREDLTALIGVGKALLALDGLDELGDGREDAETKENFDPHQRFLSLLPPNTPIIVSCRITDYAEIAQKAALKGAVTLQPLNDLQLQDYLSTQPDLWVALQADEDLRNIARIPLLLSLFAYAFNGLNNEAIELQSLASGDLRDKIFETYVRRRYEHETRKRPLPYSLEDMMTVLQHAAFTSAAYKRIIDPHEFFQTIYIDPTPMIEQTELLHLIVRVKEDEFHVHYRFIHLLLRDYFAFSVALEALGHPEDDTDNHKRAVAALALGGIGDIRAVEPLIALLNDPDNILRRNSAWALGEIGDILAVEPLLNSLHDASVDVKAQVALALGKLSDIRAVPPLIDIMRRPHFVYDWSLLQAVVSALEHIGTPEAITAVNQWKEGQQEYINDRLLKIDLRPKRR